MNEAYHPGKLTPEGMTPDSRRLPAWMELGEYGPVWRALEPVAS